MNREETSPLTLPGRMLVHQAARYWWTLLVAGLAWLVVGWVVLRADATSLATVGLLLGIVFCASGVNEAAIGGMVRGGWKLLHYAIGVIFLLGGVWAFVRPINTFFALASTLGLILVFYGAFEIARSIGVREVTPFWWAGLISGVLLLLLALWVSTSNPETSISRRTLLILFWVGTLALLRGFSEIMLAFGLRHLGTATAGRADRVTQAEEIATVVPSQARRSVSEQDSARHTAPRA
jgi:uncharacterized membrane protein HdeD (DUF308 family)